MTLLRLRPSPRAIALAVASTQCVLYALAQETTTDDDFQDEPTAPHSDPAVDGPPELQAFQSYLGYLNKAVPVLGAALLVFIYFGLGSSDPTNKKITGPRVHVSHILVDNEPDADAIRKEIKNAPKKAQKFVELAARKSACPSKTKGGHMGVFGKGQMLPEFDKIVFTEPVGSLHVVRTKFGWHVVMITKREEPPSALKRKKQ